MKAWRIDAAKVKALAVESGKHERGQRYGKALRNARRKMVEVGKLPTTLFVTLFNRHCTAYYGEAENVFRAALAQLDKEAANAGQGDVVAAGPAST